MHHVSSHQSNARSRYQFKAIVASSGEFVLENGKVTATDNDGQPVKKVSTPKTPRTKKAKKVEAEVKDDVGAGSEEESVSVVPPSPASGTKRGRAKKDGDTPAKKRQSKKQKQEVETIAEEGEDAAMDETTTVKSEEGEQAEV